jgi:dienelactone hydrolase
VHWRRPPRWWPLGLSAFTLVVSLWILVALWDPITAGHPAYFITLRLVAVVSVLVGAFCLLTRRTEPVEREPRPRWRVIAVRVVAVLATLGLVAVVLYLRPHPASSTAIDAMAGTPGATVTESSTRIRLDPTVKAATTGVVFYPGALVDPRAYVPNLLPLAEAGYPVVILKLPYDLAILDPGGAQAVMDSNPDVERWVVGGHSLGGVMAASVAGRDDARIQGLLLWGSYPNSSIADRTGLAVTSIYGSEDGLTTPADIDRTKDLLPPDTVFVEVDGGNHAFFGDYGDQGGDGVATITREQAQEEIRAASLELVQRVAGVPAASGG